MDEKGVIRYIEPVFRFCHHRLDNWHDAEDLAERFCCIYWTHRKIPD